MFIANGPNMMFAAPEERNVSEMRPRLQHFAPLELFSLVNVPSINIRLLRSRSLDRLSRYFKNYCAEDIVARTIPTHRPITRDSRDRLVEETIDGSMLREMAGRHALGTLLQGDYVRRIVNETDNAR